MKSKFIVLAAGAALLGMSGAAFAAEAMATTDLNVRSGPGTGYPVIGVLGSGQSTTIRGCLQSGTWCAISQGGEEGWVSARYLSSMMGGRQVVLTERPADSEIAVIEQPSGGPEGALVGGTTGAVGGAIVGGPVGAAVGGAAGLALGGAVGQAATPPPEVRRYITSQGAQSSYRLAEDDVVVGTQLPDNVELQEIPDYQYRYVYVNREPVLVDPSTRRIVYVMQ
jgi:hypothetical protein